jgi:hypothetical protein
MVQEEQGSFYISKKWFFALLIGLFGMATLFIIFGYEETYWFFGVPVSKHLFLDMQLITGSAESIEKGFDPILENIMDPGQRNFNYPKIWFLLLNLGLGRGALLYFGIGAIAVFFMALFLFPKTDDNLTLALIFLIAFSSAGLLAYERANVDLLFFFTVVLALLLQDKQQPVSMLVMIASILFKVFPVFALGLYWDKREAKSMLPVAALSIASLIYFGFIFSDMMTIFSVTQKGADISYGLRVAAYHLRDTGQIDEINNLALYLLVAILSAIVVTAGLLGRENLAELKNYHLRAFWAGAGIYAGTFWLGNNWDYRLIFLILVIPAMVGFSRYSKGVGRYLGWITVLAIIISCWGYGVRLRLMNIHEIREILYWIDECSNWIVYLGLVYFFMASIPDWLIPQKISHYLRQVKF